MRSFLAYAAALALGILCVEGKEPSAAASNDDTGSSSSSFEPMVAFICNMPAMHLTDHGWVKDDSVDCLHRSDDILQYCRKKYPSLDVRNIVEANEQVRITNWCSIGRTKCHHHQYLVRPFRCLVGPFQSDALLVPKHCLFDHIHESKSCNSYADWNQSAIASCRKRQMEMNSFAIIQPCDVDRFNGAEFVCCPADGPESSERTTRVETTSTVTSTKPRTTPEPSKEEAPGTKTLHRMKKTHEDWRSSVQDLHRHHHDKTLVEQHVQVKVPQTDFKSQKKGVATSTPPENADEKDEEQSVNKQLSDAVELQKLQASLNEQKRHALENYMQALSEDPISVAKVLKTLKRYIKVEQKDRANVIGHYQNMRRNDPAEAEAIFSYVDNHMRVIDQRLTQALDMLVRVPKHEKKIRQHIREFMDSFQTVDDAMFRQTSTKRPEKLITKIGKPTHPIASTLATSTSSESKIGHSEVKTGSATVAQKTSLPATVTSRSSLPATSTFARSRTTSAVVSRTVAEDRKEKKEEKFDIKPLANHAGHMDRSEFNHFEASIKKQVPSSAKQPDKSVYLATPLGITLCTIAVVLIIAVGIIVLHRRVTNVPVSNGYIDRNRWSESRRGGGGGGGGIRSQMNGYENPTYRYFEAQAKA